MNKGKTIFSQIMSLIPERDFKACVDRYKGNYRSRNFSCKDQFLVMSYAQLTGRDSLRDIENDIVFKIGNQLGSYFSIPAGCNPKEAHKMLTVRKQTWNFVEIWIREEEHLIDMFDRIQNISLLSR